MQLIDILTINAVNWPDHVAIVAGEQRTTFAQLEHASFKLANMLARRTQPGDRIAILARNTPEYVHALYGVPAAGLILTLVNYRLAPNEWAWILESSAARVLIVERCFLDAVRPHLQSLSSLEHLVVIGATTADRVQSYEELTEREPPSPPERHTSDDDPACLIYTSGTTGFPKGAVITHRNLVVAATSMGYELRLGLGDRVLMTFPMCHASGFQVFANHLRRAELHLIPAFEPGAFLELVEQQRITRTGLAPTMASFVVDHPGWDRADLSSVRTLSYGGMAMSMPLARALAERVGGLCTGFGQSETTLLVTHMGPADHRRALNGEEHLLASCGRATSFAALEICDDALERLPVGQVGELCVRSPQVMSGYWRDESETAAALTCDGWLRTGDLARQDDDGRIYIVDRKKDMLKTGGQNVYPREIELVLMGHPAVSEVAVVGLPDPVWGEDVAAAVVVRPGCTATGDELVEHCRRRLASYKKPKHVYFVDELPKNVTGKIRKSDLRAQLMSEATTAWVHQTGRPAPSAEDARTEP